MGGVGEGWGGERVYDSRTSDYAIRPVKSEENKNT